MLEKLKQIWRILFPPKQPPKPEIPERPQYDVGELMQRGEELKQMYHDRKQASMKGVCPNCRNNAEKIVTCAKCGKIGCDFCMTYDPSEGKYFCDQCW